MTGWRDSLPSNVEAPVRGQKFPDFEKKILPEEDIVNEEGGPVIKWLEPLNDLQTSGRLTPLH